MIEEYETRIASVIFPPRREDSFYTDEQRQQYFCEYRACVETLQTLDAKLVQLIECLKDERNVQDGDEEFEDIAYLKRLHETAARKVHAGRAHMASMMVNRVACMH